MRAHHAAAIAILLIPLSTVLASCILDAEPTTTADQTGEAQEELPVFVNFKRSEFPFITTVEDDGTGPAGGWQVARAKLDFSYVLFPTRIKRWQCPLGVEMPIRTETKGRFSPRRAAELAAKMANDVGRRIDYKLPQGIFCDKFISEMQKLAESPQYRGTGVKVKH